MRASLLREIAASRVRRKWGPVFGAAGAKHIYGRMFNDLVEHRISFLGVSYADFINNTHQSLEEIMDYCEIESLRVNLDRAKAFVRSP